MQSIIEYCSSRVTELPLERPREIAFLVRACEGGIVPNALNSALEAFVKGNYKGLDENGWPIWDVAKATNRAISEKSSAEGRSDDADKWKALLTSVLESQRYSAYLLPALVQRGFQEQARECASGLIRALEYVLEHGHFLKENAPKWFVADTVIALRESGFRERMEILEQALVKILDCCGVDHETNSLCFKEAALGHGKQKPTEDATAILYVAMELIGLCQTRQQEFEQIGNYLIGRLSKIPWAKNEKKDIHLRSACRVVWACSYRPEAFDKVKTACAEIRDSLRENWREWMNSAVEHENLRVISLCECVYLLKSAEAKAMKAQAKKES